MIYFDNAATSGYKPQCVIDTVAECLANYSVNPNRSGHATALAVMERIHGVRKSVAKLTGNNGSVIFTCGCTQSLNYIIQGTARNGGHVVTTVMEHNSVLRPLMYLREKGIIEVTVLGADSSGSVSSESITAAIKENTYLVIVTHASNVTGAVNNIKEIGAVCRQANVLLAVDAAQSAGYLPINMDLWGVDYLAIPAHKGLHGIMGCGALCVAKGAKLKPIIFGGTGSKGQMLLQPDDMPEGFESGTQNVPGILALGSAIEWWYENRVQLTAQQLHVHRLIVQGLQQDKNIELFGTHVNRSGIISFRVHDADNDYIAYRLSNEYDIAVRSGIHCAPLLHEHLGTSDTGLIRVSVSGTNTRQEATAFLKAMKEITNQNTVEVI